MEQRCCHPSSASLAHSESIALAAPCGIDLRHGGAPRFAMI
jgi:hypothetical protein